MTKLQIEQKEKYRIANDEKDIEKQQRKKIGKKMRKEINSNSENRYYKDQHCGYPNTSLPTKDYINLIIIMSDTEEIPVIEQEELDNPLRIILVIDHPENKESNEMEERLLDSIQSFKQMDQFLINLMKQSPFLMNHILNMK